MAYQPTKWEVEFLDKYAEFGNVTWAANAVGIARSTVYERRKSNEQFKQRMEDKRSEAIASLEQEAFKRAKDSSDTLLIFLLKSLKPDVYGDKRKVEHSGNVAMDKEAKAVQDIQEGKLTFDGIAAAFDEDYARKLFALAGKSVDPST